MEVSYIIMYDTCKVDNKGNRILERVAYTRDLKVAELIASMLNEVISPVGMTCKNYYVMKLPHWSSEDINNFALTEWGKLEN